ncbi:Transporter [hydrothermal vent metagenome]|uniref:Transporter n=1 Tax=hydrothermal vent metagenome TaxID=652676 RepID=A0A160VDV1_9ZZZZ
MWAFFKRITLAGLFAIVPLALTFYIIKIIIVFLDQLTAPIMARINLEIPGFGLILTLLIIFALGIFVTNVLGRRLFSWGERLISSIPLVKNIYNTLKQITNAFSGATQTENYQRVIYIQYPRKELWTISFVTSESVDGSGEEYYHVFVPTTPNPTSGVFIIVPKKDAIEADLTIEEGLKAVISGGLLAPKQSPLDT